MAEQSKPAYNYIWSSGGAIVAPSDAKIQSGWTAEVPPFQWENWSQNRQDQAIVHILQHGISVWDNLTEYQASKSYVQGSDGVVYKSLTTNTNINPVTDWVSNPNVNWAKTALLPVATTAQAQARTSNDVLLSPLQLDNAFKGSANQALTVQGYQKLPGGLILQWGKSATTTTTASVSFPVAFTTGVLWIGQQDTAASLGTLSLFQLVGVSNTGFTAQNICSLSSGVTTVNGASAAACQWFAIGV